MNKTRTRAKLIGLVLTGLLGFFTWFVGPNGQRPSNAAESKDAVKPLSSRNRLSLDGTWQFATDPEKVGEKQNWFQSNAKMAPMPRTGYAPEAQGTIRVPGIWDNQGYGTETLKLKHNFVGHGWYKRTFDIPASWKGNELFLTLGGVSRYAKVWINGRSAGKETIGQVASFSFNITDLVLYGAQNDITIRVDSDQRWEVDAILGAASLNDYMNIEWGGLWGHVNIEAKPKERIDDLYLKTDLKNSKCIAQATVFGAKKADSAILEVFDKNGQKVAEHLENLSGIQAGSTITVAAKIDQPNLWTPDTPYLYQVRLSLIGDGKTIDSLENRYGMRELRAEGTRILLNGKPLFLRGYGDDHIYPYEFSMPTDKEMFLARLKVIKAFGFNHVRHHSTILPHEYYEACDEIGIMPTGEFPIGYPSQIPGAAKWLQNVPKGTPLEPALNVYRERFEQVVREYRNHPSILAWIMGNELWEGMSINKDFKEIASRLDPQRFFCDSDGDWPNYFMQGKDRNTLDLCFVLFNEWISPFLQEKFDVHGFKKPVISHEAGNFITFSRPDQADLFEKGNFSGNPTLAGKSPEFAKKLNSDFKPFWMTDGIKKLDELKLTNETEDWARATEEIYYIHHKYNVESMRLNNEISGYHWWLIQDYWTTSNGLVDLFFRPKSIAPERVRVFNNDLVLLQKRLELTARSGDVQKYQLLISNFSDRAISGRLERTTLVAATGYSKSSEHAINGVKSGELAQVALIDEKIPQVDQPAEMEVRVALKDSSGKLIQKNAWKVWIYPRTPKINSNGKKVYVSEEVRECFPDLNLPLIPDSDNLDVNAIYVTSDWDIQLANVLNNGAGLVLLSESTLLPATTIQYQQTWWKGGDSDATNHVGTYVYPTSLMKSLESANWCQPHWFYLLNGAVKYHMDKFPQRPNIHIRALPSLVRVQDTAILFEVAVGKGTLLISGLNHIGAKGRPENTAVLLKLIERAGEASKPSVGCPLNFFQSPVSLPDGMTLGFRRILPSKYEEARWKNFRSDNVRNLVCRQDNKENYLSWRTAAVDKTSDAATFIFAGGLGFSGEPVTDGFALELGGRQVLTFDIPQEDAKKPQWKSKDGKIVLTFDIRRFETQDRFGVFLLTVPREYLSGSKKGENLTVRSLGSGSRRWFAVNPIVDLK